MSKEIITDFSVTMKARLALHPCIYVLKVDKEGNVWRKIDSEEGDGVWVDATMNSLEGLKRAIQDDLSFDGEYYHPSSIQGCVVEGYNDFGDIKVDQLPSLEAIHEFALFFTEYGELGVALLRYLNSPQGEKLTESKQLLAKHYYGAFKSEIDFVRAEHARLNIAAPKEPSACQAIADYWFQHTYFYLEISGALHVFDRL